MARTSDENKAVLPGDPDLVEKTAGELGGEAAEAQPAEEAPAPVNSTFASRAAARAARAARDGA